MKAPTCTKTHTPTARAKQEQRRLLWATATFGAAKLPDARLRQRAIMFLAQKAAAPGDSITHGAKDQAAANADYRLLENKRMSADPLWQSIHEDTANHVAGRECILSIQDTTTLMFPGLKATKGLGTIDRPVEEGLLMHSALAVGLDGQPIGLLYNHVWARPLEEFGKGADRKKRTVKEKESYEWVLGIRLVTELRREHFARTKVIHVFDRGGDVYEVLHEVVSSGQDAIIRCCQNRRVEGEYGYIRETLAARPILKRCTIEVRRKHGQPRRRATVEIRSATIALPPPAVYPDRAPLTLQAVWVHEPDPPHGVEALDWLLLTTLPVKTAKQCMRVIKFYKVRWRVEDFHLTLKSGCKIEETQLKQAERIEILLTLCCAVAVRILQLTYLARTDPDAPCTIVLCEDEWKVLWAYVHKQPIARAHSPPTIREAVRMIARLGGHLGRKCDGMPGVRTLWRGWRDLQLMVDGYRVTG